MQIILTLARDLVMYIQIFKNLNNTPHYALF